MLAVNANTPSALRPHPVALRDAGSMPRLQKIRMGTSAANGARLPRAVRKSANRFDTSDDPCTGEPAGTTVAIIATVHQIEVVDFYKQETK